MSRKNHNPSLARKIARHLKNGESPESLIPLVKSITDSYYISISYFNLASFGFNDSKQTSKSFTSGFSELAKISQSWRRIELLGEISKILKRIADSSTKNKQYAQLLSSSFREKTSDTKDFLVKNCKNFPASMLKEMLEKVAGLGEDQFLPSKAIIRTWISKGNKGALLDSVLESNSNIKIKLLGYIHLQFNKGNLDINPTPLELALKLENLEEHLNYLVRVCSTPKDLESFSQLSLDSDTLLALAVRADRKGFTDYYEKILSEAGNKINSLPSSSEKERLLSKYENAKTGSSHTPTKKTDTAPSFSFPLVNKGKHTLGLFNTYGGNWNHPHFKTVYKASKLCSAFDLDLALIGFPVISPKKLVKEVSKEMRITRNDFLSELLSLERVLFFEKDIDESLVGRKVVTTSNPDTNKTTLPSEKLCMVMGLGPKGLPKSYINKSDYHFELTGLNVAFETGTAMGALSSELGQLP